MLYDGSTERFLENTEFLLNENPSHCLNESCFLRGQLNDGIDPVVLKIPVNWKELFPSHR